MSPPEPAPRDGLDTLPKLLRDLARHRGGEVALRQKDLGIWRQLTWADYHALAGAWALGLASLGVRPGDTVAIIGASRPDWVAAAVGTHALRAMSLGLYQDALEGEAKDLLQLSGATVVVAEDEEQVDKLLRIADALPQALRIVFCDPRGMRKYRDARLVSRAALFERAGAADPDAYDRLVDASDGADPALLCSTSGTTGTPKLAMLAAGRFIRHVGRFVEALGIGPDDEYVSMLPMAWIGEQSLALFQPIVAGHRLSFVEETETAMADMREVGPSFILLAPRVWEQIAANVRARMLDASWLKRRLFAWGMRTALAAVERGGRSRMAYWLVLRALKDRLGFSRLRMAMTGGAAMGPDTFKFFMAMGVPMLQLYGQTELAGIYTTHRPGDVDFDSVGPALGPEYEVQIRDPDAGGVGEIWCRHPYMFLGYHGSAAAGLEDGWLGTGDAGYLGPNGHLVVIDRIRDLATTAGGDRFSPQFIENKLKFSPYVSEAVILGDGRAWPAAIVCVRFEIVAKWAEGQRIAFTTYSDLVARPEVQQLVRREVEAVNATLPPAQRIRRLVLLHKELDADDGELTRTRKVRRGVIAEKYGEIIQAIYGGADAVPIDTVIAFQDGSRQRVRTSLRVISLDEAAAALAAAA